MKPGRHAVWLSLIILFSVSLAAAAQSKKQPPAKPLDLNSATVEQLTALPGIGPATAAAIVQFRQKSGPFRRVEDLLAIRGISSRKLGQIRPYVIVTPALPQHANQERP